MIKAIVKLTGDDARYLFGIIRRQPKIIFWRAVIDKINVIQGDIKMLILTNSQEVDLAIKPLDRRGKPAQVDGVPAWSLSNPALGQLVVADDGLSSVFKALDNGTVQVSVSADADLGDGVETISGTLDIEIVSGKATSLGIIAGTPREQAL